MLDLVWWAWFRWQLPLKTVVGDSRYGTIDNIVVLEHNGIRENVSHGTKIPSNLTFNI